MMLPVQLARYFVRYRLCSAPVSIVKYYLIERYLVKRFLCNTYAKYCFVARPLASINASVALTAKIMLVKRAFCKDNASVAFTAKIMLV